MPASPLVFETKIPAEARVTDGPEGGRAVVVTVPDIERDEKACAASLPLPPLAGEWNGLRVWVKGSAATKRLEIVIRTTAGNFATEVSVEPEWRQVLIAAQDMRPWFSPEDSALNLTRATQLRLCIGAWQGHGGGPHEYSLGPVEAVYSPLFRVAPAAEELAARGVPLPPQPFTVELLDLNRGRWEFVEALGGRLALDGPVVGYAFPPRAEAEPAVAYLCCDPEFPDDPAHGMVKFAGAIAEEGETRYFRIDEPYLSCGVVIRPAWGALRCELHDVRLGPATTGDRYLAALYVQADGKLWPVWLAPDVNAPVQARLLTDRVGHVFVGEEPCRVLLSGMNAGVAREVEFTVRVTDYRTGREAHRERTMARLAGGSVTRHELTLPLKRYGVFEVSAEAEGYPTARVRVCRIPAPRKIDPEASRVGMNLFQQQVWWYAYQVPLMARAGVHWLRPWLAWENTWRTQEPRPGEWDPRALDAALRRMEAHGLRYEYILFAAPDWVADPGRSSVPPVERMDQWAAWVEKLVTRYRDRVKVWEVWNEPDLMWPEDSRHSGEHYLAMLKATYAAARRADPGCTVQGLSHAGYEDWLAKVGDLGAAPHMDQATIHSYALPREFATHVERRKSLLAAHGMSDRPVWVNEFGAPAFDFSAAYSAQYGCSEAWQANVLTANYAQAFALTGGKAFWFCTLDPRDPAHESQWTYDAGTGVLYLGFLPKLSYVALAGVGQMLDGRECAGRVEATPAVRHVAFEGPVSVVWSDDPAQEPSITATALGCAPEEQLAVRDSFTNEIARGRARDLTLDLTGGPVYVEGSRQLMSMARVEGAVTVGQTAIALEPGERTDVEVRAPEGVTLAVEPSATSRTSATLRDDGRRLTVTAPPGASRGEEWLRLTGRAAAGTLGLVRPLGVRRSVRVTVGEPNLLRDGVFALGHVLEWSPERASPYTCDAAVGHEAPGSLRLDGPFDRRLVQFNLPADPSRALRLSFWVKTESLADCALTANVALFAQDRWLTSPCLASTRPDPPAPNAVATIPTGTCDWTRIEAALPAEQIPDETKHYAFYLDAAGGEGRVWFDELDFWQP
ncbi:MAG: hypothetical protein FJX74_14805 [Armatimonadetes bacterium]|nr:hypothetical protein [Armatimonadota bacterium]